MNVEKIGSQIQAIITQIAGEISGLQNDDAQVQNPLIDQLCALNQQICRAQRLTEVDWHEYAAEYSDELTRARFDKQREAVEELKKAQTQ